MTFHTPSADLVNAYLKEIAKGYGVDWSPDPSPDEDASFGGDGGGGGGGVKVNSGFPSSVPTKRKKKGSLITNLCFYLLGTFRNFST